MTEQQNNTTQTIFMAIDIAKLKHDVLIKWPCGKQKLIRIKNTLSGFEYLLAEVNADKHKIIAAIEPTADYHRLIAYWLANHEIQIHLASSLASARAREMLFSTWDKHDRKDTHVIMYLLQNGLTKPFHDPLVHHYMDIQELSNTYQQIVLARGRCYHSLLNHYLTLYFPEMERYLHNSRSQWFCRLMLKFPTPCSITRLSVKQFVHRAWKVVGRKVSKQRFLEELYELAHQSIGLPVALESTSIQMFKLQLQRYLDLTQQRDQLEQCAHTLLDDHPDYLQLQTLPGVGPIIALMILAESGDLRRFKHYRQYLKFCGFNLCSVQSGQFQGQYKLSKRGNARLRYAFWLAANRAIRQTENSFRAKYERYIKKDPTNADLKRKARTAVAVKMARVAHALIKKQTSYRGYHEFGFGT